MSDIRLATWLVLGLAAPSHAAAAWLRCTEIGNDAQGAFAMVTSVVDVGDVGQSRAASFEQLLAAYTAKTVPESTEKSAQCSISDDYQETVSQYGRFWSAATRRYGWGRTTLVPPSAWLPDDDVKSNPGNF